MCQLTFVNTNDKEFNKRMLVNQFLVNTVVRHKDGWGFFTEKSGVFKTRLEPWNTSDIGEVIKDSIENNEPILAHVRLATYTNLEKEISDEKAHPFETANFIVAHNGKFEGDIIKEERFKGMIDSEIFAHILEETYKKFPKMSPEKLINQAYADNFTGKFALLVYFKPKKRYYIIRGKTAELHKIDVFKGKTRESSKKIGYVINTEKIDLIRAFKFADKSSQLTSDEFYFRSEIEELEKETSYIVNTTFLRKLGEMKELNKVVTTTFSVGGHDDTWKNDSLRNRRSYAPAVSYDSTEKFLIKLYDEYGLSIPEIDRFFIEITGFAAITADKNTFELFQEMSEPFLKFHGEHKHNLWKNLIKQFSNPLDAYNTYKLQFPYFLNSIKDLDNKWIEVRDGQKALQAGEKKC